MEIVLFDEKNNFLELEKNNLNKADKVFIKLEEDEIINGEQFIEDIEKFKEKTIINLIGAKLNKKEIDDIKKRHANFDVYETMKEAPLSKLLTLSEINKKIGVLGSQNITIPKDINSNVIIGNQLVNDQAEINRLRNKYKSPDGLSRQEYLELQGQSLPFVQRRIHDLLYTHGEESYHHKWSEDNFKDLTERLKNLTMNELTSVKEQAKAHYKSDPCDKFINEGDFEDKKKEWQADLDLIIQIADRSNCQDVTAFDTKIDQQLTQTLNNLAKKISNLPYQELIDYTIKQKQAEEKSFLTSSKKLHQAKTDLAKLLLAYNRASPDSEEKKNLWNEVETFIKNNPNVLKGTKLKAFYEQSKNESSKKLHQAKIKLATLLMAYNRPSPDNPTDKQAHWEEVEAFIKKNQNVLDDKDLEVYYEQSKNDHDELVRRGGKPYDRSSPQ